MVTPPTPARCGSALAWCWVRPADALTGAMVRSCPRHYVEFVSLGGAWNRREFYRMCATPRGSRGMFQEGRCA